MKTTLLSFRLRRVRAAAAIANLLVLLLARTTAVQAANGSWNVDSDGTWSDSANWLNNIVATDPGSTAYFTNDITGIRTVTISAAQTNGNLQFADADPASSVGGWIVTGSTLTLSNSAATPVINVNPIGGVSNGQDSTNDVIINSVVAGGQGFIKTGDGNVTLGGANTMGPVRLDAGVATVANAAALGANNRAVTFNGGGVRVYGGGPTYANTNIVTTGTIISSNNNYDAFNGPWFGSGTMYIHANTRLTIGGGSATALSQFTGTIDLSDSPANEIRINLGSGATPYNLSTVTLNTGTNAGRFDFRPTTSPVTIQIGALLGGANTRLDSSEQAAGTHLTWAIGFLNTSTTFAGEMRNRNGAFERVGHLLKVGTGKLTLTGTNTYTGNTTISNGVLALSGGGLIANSTLTNAQSITVVSPGVFDVSGRTEPYSLPLGRTLAGNGAIAGTFVATNGLISPGLSVGTLTFSNNLTLGGTEATNFFEITGPGVHDQILIGGNLNLDGTCIVRVMPTAAVIPNGIYPLYKWTGTLTGDTNFLTLEYPPQTGTVGLEVNLGAKEIRLVVTGVAGAANITWRGDGSANNWDTTTPNWRNGGSPSTFTSGDHVTFDNTGSNTPPINLTDAMNPGSIVVNATKDYNLGTISSGSLTGSGSIVKTNTGRLILTTDNTTAGPVTNQFGVLQLGDNGSSGSLGTSPINLANNASLFLQRGDSFNAANVISGSGNVVQSGSGTTTLAGANSHSGGTIVSNGVLNIASPGGLGSGTLVLAGGTMSAANITVPNPLNVVENSTINNTSGEIQLTSESITGAAGKTLTLTGSQLRLTGSNITFNAAIDNGLTLRSYNSYGVQTFNGVISGSGQYQRRFPDTQPSFDGATVFNAANTYSGGTLLRQGFIGFGINSVSAFPPTIDSGPIGTGTLTQDNAPGTGVFASGGARTVGNPIVLNVTAGIPFIIKGSFPLTLSGTIDLGGADKEIQVDNTAASTLSGDISNGNLIKTGNGALYINGNNSANSTVVSNGTLGGTGTFSGAVTVVAGATLAPGASVGTMTLNSDLTLAGNLAIEVNRSLSPSNDIVNVSGVLTNAGTGTLTVANLGAVPLAIGNSFTLFNQPLLNGNALTVTGAGVTWSNALAVNGSIVVTALAPAPKPVITTTALSGTNLIFSGTNGGSAGSTFYVVSSTNITAPLNTWTTNSTGTYGPGGVFTVTNPIVPGIPRNFYNVKTPVP